MATTLNRGATLQGERAESWFDVARRALSVERDLTAPWALELTLLGLLLWFFSLKQINIREMNDLGLVSVLPPMFYLALLATTAGFCVSLLQAKLSYRLLLFQLAVLILMLYGVTILVEDVPRFVVTWLHAGFAEYIGRTGHLAPQIDARFSWPILFILSAFVTQIAGLPNAISFAAWAPVAFNLLYLGPLILILQSATRDRRLVAVGVWFFYLTNWIGQDYFSPQGLNFFFYLLIIAILLKWFKSTSSLPDSLPAALVRLGSPGRAAGRLHARFRIPARAADWLYEWVRPADTLVTESTPATRVALVTIILLIFSVVASSHQLTPFFLLVAVGLLVVFNRISLRGLPVIMAVIIGLWISYMTVTFLSGHLDSVTGNVGKLGDTVGANVGGRFKGSPDHVLVLYTRLALTAGVWGLAGLGWLLRVLKGRRDLTFVLLAVAPFPLIFLQDYGGEMLLRVYLFALPAMLFFAASIFYPTASARSSWVRAAAVGVVSLLLLAGFMFSRYGNERMDSFSSDEVTAVEYMYGVAQPNSLLIAPVPSVPWKSHGIENYTYLSAGDNVPPSDANVFVSAMADKKYPAAYLLLSRSQEAYAELYYGVPAASWNHFAQAVRQSPKLHLIYSNQDAEVFVLADRGKQATP
ncbi:MAG: hypothetical protein ACR2M0_16030 [Chloroflexia bacterium]